MPMIRINGTNTVRNLGDLDSDLSVSGTNSTVYASIPSNRSVQIKMTGTNSSIYISGSGRLNLDIEGTNCSAIVSPDIDASISTSGTNSSVHRSTIRENNKISKKMGNNVYSSFSDSNNQSITFDPEISINVTSTNSKTNYYQDSTGLPNKNEKDSLDKCPSCDKNLNDEKNILFCPFCGHDM